VGNRKRCPASCCRLDIYAISGGFKTHYTHVYSGQALFVNEMHLDNMKDSLSVVIVEMKDFL